MNEWKNTTIEEVKAYKFEDIASIVDCEHKTAPIDINGKYYSVRTSDIKNGVIAYNNCNRISKTTYEEWTNRILPQKGDILLAREAPVGEVGLVTNNNTCLGQRTVLIRVSNGKASNKYILYYLMNPVNKFKLIQKSSGSVVQHLNMKDIRNHEINIPSIFTQQTIAEVLSSLDDKIDLLHRQNKTLEEMAETLFRQWFIEERDEGWEEKPLSSIADFLNGLACQKFPPKNEIDKLPVLKIKQLRSGFTEDCDWASTDIKTEYLVENGDVIFSWSASLMVKIWDGDRCILNQHLFKVTSNEFPKWFYYQWCKYYLAEFTGKAESHATTMGHIKRCDLDNAIVLVPSYEELFKFSEGQTPLIEKIIQNNKYLSKLEILRDTLLPRLMSGEVRVKYGK